MNLRTIPKIIQAYVTGFQLNSIYNSIYFRTFQEAYNKRNGNITTKSAETFYKEWLRLCDRNLDNELKSSSFTSLLAQYISTLVELRTNLRKEGYPVYYFGWLFDCFVRNIMVFASIEKDFDLSPFDTMSVRGKTRLLHYKSINKHTQDIEPAHPILMIYAPINRFHIMDISQERSVVKSLLSNGLDVYLLDWGYPGWEDSSLSLTDYVNYVRDAIQDIKDKTGKGKVSILGYCWGGIIALIYSALSNENVRNLTLMAAPVDFSKDNTILANWARVIDSDQIIDEFGHLDGQVLDIGFLMRNPPLYIFDKYLKLFERYNDKQFVDTFISVEKWLYDTPIIPGNLYRHVIKDCYKNNLLISNKMKVDGSIIDLKKITAPLLTIVAEDDDLVSPESALAIKDYVSSKDKESLTIVGGHVGLCTSRMAHEKLWPEAAEWILSN
ncbi:MAG: alpha/beta fold hydrolase [Candidatus Nitrosopolaris sp.]